MTKTAHKIPKASLALIGGSSTLALQFPEDVDFPGVTLLESDLVFSTPFGPSPPMKHFSIADGEQVLTCRMHGWRPGVTRRNASLQIFSVFREAGVGQVLAEGGVGSINLDLNPGDFVIPDDYLDWSCRRDTSLTDDFLLIMREPCCQKLRDALAESIDSLSPEIPVARRGVYAVTDGRHFESRAEIRALAGMGADIVGQSLAPEVYLAREIGACYAGLHQVVNRAEGIGEDWSHDELKSIFYGRSEVVGRIMLETLSRISGRSGCSCASLRKNTLLKTDGPQPE